MTKPYARSEKNVQCPVCEREDETIRKGVRRGKQKGWCRRCRASFTVQPGPPRRDRLILQHHLDGIPYRKLKRTYRIGKNRLNRIVNARTTALPPNDAITEQLHPTYADGIFLADGKAFACKHLVTLPNGQVVKRKIPNGRTVCSLMHWASHDLPVIRFSDDEDIAVWLTVFRRAKELGLDIRILVCDDRRACWTAALIVFPKVIIQLCHAHITREVERKLGYQHIERRLGKLGREIDRLWTSMERPGFLVGKRRAVTLVNQMAEIEHRSEFLLAFAGHLRELLASETAAERDARWAFLIDTWFPTYDRLAPHDPHRSKIRRVWRKVVDRQEELFASLRFPDESIPKTTNALEGWHNQIEIRCASIRGFESPETGDTYLNALTIWRRLRPFTDCANGFKHLNGRSPLEAAGVDLPDTDDWISHCPEK